MLALILISMIFIYFYKLNSLEKYSIIPYNDMNIYINYLNIIRSSMYEISSNLSQPDYTSSDDYKNRILTIDSYIKDTNKKLEDVSDVNRKNSFMVKVMNYFKFLESSRNNLKDFKSIVDSNTNVPEFPSLDY
jgi:hypothetical protein